MRASHRRHHRPLVFDDRFAAQLLSAELRESVDDGRLQAQCDSPEMACIQGQVLGRARYVEDQLAAARHEVEQYVIVGAGLDSFVLRRPEQLEQLRVFEVDHPATQRTKRARLAAAGFEPSALLLSVRIPTYRSSGSQPLLAISDLPGR